MKTMVILSMLLCMFAPLAMGGNLDIVLVEDVSASCRGFETNFNNFKRNLVVACLPGDHFERITNGPESKVVVSNYVRTKSDLFSIEALSVRTNYPLLSNYDLTDVIEKAYLRLLQRANNSECKSAVILITDGITSENDAERVSKLIAKMQSNRIAFYLAGTKKTNSLLIRSTLEFGATYSEVDTAQPSLWVEKMRANINVQDKTGKDVEIKDLENRIKEANRQLQQLSDNEQGKKKNLSSIEKLIEQRKIEANTVKSELVQLNQQRDTMTKSIADLSEQCRQNELKQKTINAQIEESKRDLNKTDLERDELNSVLSALKSEQASMKQEIAQKERILADANNLSVQQIPTIKIEQIQVPDKTTAFTENVATTPDPNRLQNSTITKDPAKSIFQLWVVIPIAVIVLLTIGFFSIVSWLRRREFQMTVNCITSTGHNIANSIHILPKCEIVPLTGESLESEISKCNQTDYAYIYVDFFGNARLCANGENAINMKVNGESLSSSNLLLNLGDSIDVSLQEGSLTYILTDLCTAAVSESENLTMANVA